MMVILSPVSKAWTSWAVFPSGVSQVSSTLHFWPALPESSMLKYCPGLWAGFSAERQEVIGECAKAKPTQAKVVTRAPLQTDRTMGQVSFFAHLSLHGRKSPRIVPLLSAAADGCISPNARNLRSARNQRRSSHKPG